MKFPKILLALIFALVFSVLSASAEGYASPHLGEPLEDFTVNTIDGGTFTLSEALTEKDLVIINFWATWCPPCEMEFPYLQEAYELYQDRVEVVALSTEPKDTDEKLTEYVEAHGMTFPVGRTDGTDLKETFAMHGIPTTLAIDRFGNIGFVETGALTSPGAFTRLFDAFLGEDYTETAILYEVPPATPDVEPEDEAKLAAVLNVEGGALAFTNDPDEFVWPMRAVEKDGRTALVSTNAGNHESVSRVLATVSASEGDALAFDFATSSEIPCDFLRVSVDGEVVKSFSGERDWTTWAVALSEGEHDIAFEYAKDPYMDAGEDAIWLDEVRLVSGEEAAALLASLPVYPTGAALEFSLMTEGAKEIVFEGENVDIVNEILTCQSYWILPGDTAELSITITEDIDPDVASCYSTYDGLQLPLVQLLNEDGTGYVVTSKIDSMENTGYNYTEVYFYPHSVGADASEPLGIGFFANEENVNTEIKAIAEYYGVTGLTWRYADGTEPTSNDVAEGKPTGLAEYTVVFTDQNGDPVPDCVINFCTDEACLPVFADENGIATFSGEPYAYHLQVIRVPEGYEFDTAQEFYAEEAGGELQFTIIKK